MTLSADLELVECERLAVAVLDDIGTAQRTWKRQNRRPRALSAREALVALQFEAMLVGVAASNLANGVELTEVDLDRLLVACARISAISDEAIG